MIRSKDDTTRDLIGIKFNAVMIAGDTHEIAAVAHMLVHGNSKLAHFDLNDLRRSIDRLKITVADMDSRLTAVEKDMPAPHRPEYARQMEVA